MLRTLLLLPVLALLLVADPVAAATCRGKVVGRDDTLRFLEVRDERRALRAALCDTRYGKVVIPSAPGINRGDGYVTALRRAGTKVLYHAGYDESSYARIGIADVRTGRWTRLDDYGESANVPDRAATYLDAGGLAAWTHLGGRESSLVAHRDGHTTVLDTARTTGSARGPVRVEGGNLTWGLPRRAVPLARLARFRTCFPGDRADAVIRLASDAAWVKAIAGRLYACAPTGAPRTVLRCADPGHARVVAAGPTVAAVCGTSPATLTVADLTTGATRLDTALGVDAGAARLTISPAGAVAWIDRGATALRALMPGAPAPQDVDTAVRVANPRWTADRSLAWSRITRAGGAPVARTTTLP